MHESRRITWALSLLFLTSTFLGVGPAGGQVAGDPSPEGPTREDLETKRIFIEQNGPGWTAQKLVVTPEIWEGEWGPESGHVRILIQGWIQSEDTVPVRGVGWKLTSHSTASLVHQPWNWTQVALDMRPQQTYLLLLEVSCSQGVLDAAWEGLVGEYWEGVIGADCGENPPDMEMAGIIGVPDADDDGHANISYGLSSPGDTNFARDVPDRPVIDLGTTIHGDHAQGGTLHPGVHVGDVEVVEEPIAGELAHRLRVGFDTDFPQPGVVDAFFSAAGAGDANLWRADWSFSFHEGSAVGVGHPFLSAHGPTEAGATSVQIEQQFDIGDMVVLWGYVSGDLLEQYGWSLEPQVSLGDPSIHN